MPDKKPEQWATSEKPEREGRCPFCDKSVTVKGHWVEDDRVTHCPSIGHIMTPGQVI